MHTEAFKTLKLAGPIIVGELAQMALHIVDAAMVGTISYKHLAAAALVLNVMNIPFILGIGMTISVSQLVSLSNGRNDVPAVSHYFFNGFLLCTCTAVFISVSLVLGRGVLAHLGQDAEVVALALPFMKLLGLSVIPMILFMALKQFADGLEYTKTAMLLSLLALPVNILLNWLLIYGNWGFPRMELTGAGWATIITRTLIFVALGVVIFRHPIFQKYMAERHAQWRLNRKTWSRLLAIGIPSSLQIGMEAGAFALSGILIGTISVVAQAAHQIALSCASFTFMVSLGLAQACSIRTSNALGNGDWLRIKKIGASTLLVALIYGVVCAFGFALLKNWLPPFFNSNAEVLQLAGVLLLLAAVFQISDSTQTIGAGLLRGIKDVTLPTFLIAIAYWVVGLPVGYFLAVKYKLGAQGLWLGLILGLTLSSILLILRFRGRVVKQLAVAGAS